MVNFLNYYICRSLAIEDFTSDLEKYIDNYNNNSIKAHLKGMSPVNTELIPFKIYC
jgi:hypothetical protein